MNWNPIGAIVGICVVIIAVVLTIYLVQHVL